MNLAGTPERWTVIERETSDGGFPHTLAPSLHVTIDTGFATAGKKGWWCPFRVHRTTGQAPPALPPSPGTKGIFKYQSTKPETSHTDHTKPAVRLSHDAVNRVSLPVTPRFYHSSSCNRLSCNTIPHSTLPAPARCSSLTTLSRTAATGLERYNNRWGKEGWNC